MGNTNIPQFGAADTANSHDTRTGDRQLTEEQRKQRDAQAHGGIDSLLPERRDNESQRLVEHADHGKDVIGKPAPATEPASRTEGAVSNLQPTAEDRAALAGHVDTGHSPSDAT